MGPALGDTLNTSATRLRGDASRVAYAFEFMFDDRQSKNADARKWY